MPGIAIIKCHMCGHKGPLLRGGDKAVNAHLKKLKWTHHKKYGLCCPACSNLNASGASDMDFAMRRHEVAKARTGGGSRGKGKRLKARRRPAAEVEVLTETHLPSKFKTQDRVIWNGKEYKLGQRPATVIAVRDKLGHWRYKIRLDTSVKSMLRGGAFREIDVPEKALHAEQASTRKSAKGVSDE